MVYLILPYLPLAEMAHVSYQFEGVEDSQSLVYVVNSIHLITYKMLNIIYSLFDLQFHKYCNYKRYIYIVSHKLTISLVFCPSARYDPDPADLQLRPPPMKSATTGVIQNNRAIPKISSIIRLILRDGYRLS